MGLNYDDCCPGCLEDVPVTDRDETSMRCGACGLSWTRSGAGTKWQITPLRGDAT